MSPYRRCGVVASILIATAALAACGVTPGSGPAPGPTAPPTFAGISVTSSDHSVGLRDLHVPDPGAAGYRAGTGVPVAVQVWNNTNAPISLTAGTAFGRPVVLAGAAEQASATFTVSVPAGGFVPLTREAGRHLVVPCVPTDLGTGAAIDMTFVFSNGAKIAATVPVGAFAGSSTPPGPTATAAACA